VLLASVSNVNSQSSVGYDNIGAVTNLDLFSSSFNEHLQRLRFVFDRFRESGLKLKLTKCHFAGRSVKCLGHIVSDKGIMTDPDKIEVIRTWPQPTTARDVKTTFSKSIEYEP
jgi:hypothetical protein